MRCFLSAGILFLGSLALADEPGRIVVGTVVSVPDGDSLWVYIPEVQASYHFALAGAKAPPLDQPLGRDARDVLARLVLGREVTVSVARLSQEGETPGNIFVNGRSVNRRMDRFLSARMDGNAPSGAVSARPPLAGICSVLRIVPFLAFRIVEACE